MTEVVVNSKPGRYVVVISLFTNLWWFICGGLVVCPYLAMTYLDYFLINSWRKKRASSSIVILVLLSCGW